MWANTIICLGGGRQDLSKNLTKTSLHFYSRLLIKICHRTLTKEKKNHDNH